MTYQPSIAERIAWTSGQLPASDVKVLTALWSCGDYETGRNCHAYRSTLAERAGVSIGTVMRCLRRLKDPTQPGGPWIVGVYRHRQATRYHLCLDRLATRPPKEQQMPILEAVDAPGLEDQNDPQGQLGDHFDPQPLDLEDQNDPPTSDPDLVPEDRTHTLRAREAHAAVEDHNDPLEQAGTLPLMGPTPPPKCTHPHAHAWCEGRVHVPRDLHFEFFDRLGTRPGETPTQKTGRLVAFYAATMAATADGQDLDEPYTFWKRAYAAWVKTQAQLVAPVAAPPRVNVWALILQRIEAKVPRHEFYTWFRGTTLVEDQGDEIHIAGPEPNPHLHIQWIQKHYADVVTAAIADVRPGARVTFIDRHAERKQA